MILDIVQILFVVLIFAAAYKRDIAIFLYVVFLPINTILPSSYNVLGLISYPNILFIIAFYHLYFWDTKIIETPIRKICIRIIWIFLLYMLYSDFRHAWLNILPIAKNLNPYVEAFRNILKWIPLVLLIMKMNNEYFNKIVFRAFIVSVAILVLSVAFALPLSYLGFKVEFTTEFEYQQNIRMPVYMRNSGFLGDGDFNVLGALLNMLFAFCLSYFTINDLLKKKEAILCIFLCILGVILTGSRMAILTLAIVVVYSIWEVSSLKKIIRYTIIGLTLVLIMWQLGFLDFMFDRFREQNTIGELSLNERYSRVNRWISYINYSTTSLNRLIFGYDSIHYFTGREFRDAHNLYLRMLYFSGIVFVTLFVIQLIKIINYALYENTQFRMFLILVPCLISTMIIGQHTWMYFLLLIVSINDVATD